MRGVKDVCSAFLTSSSERRQLFYIAVALKIAKGLDA